MNGEACLPVPIILFVVRTYTIVSCKLFIVSFGTWFKVCLHFDLEFVFRFDCFLPTIAHPYNIAVSIGRRWICMLKRLKQSPNLGLDSNFTTLSFATPAFFSFFVWPSYYKPLQISPKPGLAPDVILCKIFYILFEHNWSPKMCK